MLWSAEVLHWITMTFLLVLFTFHIRYPVPDFLQLRLLLFLLKAVALTFADLCLLSLIPSASWWWPLTSQNANFFYPFLFTFFSTETLIFLMDFFRLGFFATVFRMLVILWPSLSPLPELLIWTSSLLLFELSRVELLYNCVNIYSQCT